MSGSTDAGGLGIDALDPQELPDLVREAIQRCIVNPRKWNASMRQEQREQELVARAFQGLARRFPK